LGLYLYRLFVKKVVSSKRGFKMFNIGMQELIVILIIALLVLGPKRLPEVARALGKGIREFRKATQEVKESVDIQGELKRIEDEITDEVISTENKNQEEKEGKKKVDERK